jgi:MarR family 2-MHQ and catechol resistance regulon transcriptional repressor
MKNERTSSYLALNSYAKLMQAAETVTVRVSRIMTAAGLTISQFGVLEALFNKAPLCQREIAAKILKSTGNITMVIDNLEKQELVKRERSSVDRRYLTVTLTGKGEALISAVFSDVEAAIIAEMNVLTESEQEMLGSLCKKLGLRD